MSPDSTNAITERRIVACGGLLPVTPYSENRPGLFDGTTGVWRTRAQVRNEAVTIAESLHSPQRRLAFILSRQDAQTLISVLAAAAAGHVVALIDDSITEQKVLSLIEAYRPEFVSCSDRDKGTWLKEKGYSKLRAPVESAWFIKHKSEAAPEARIHPSLFVLLATSGTTGIPRFVRLSQSAVLANAVQIAEVLAIDERSVGIAHLPIHYSYGWSLVTSHLTAGASVIMLDDSVMSRAFWEVVAKTGGSHFPGVPFHYTTVARLGLNAIPACVTTFTQAGGPLDLRTQTNMHEFAEKRSGRFFVMYGQTEAAPRMTTLRHSAFRTKAGSVGLALPRGEVSITRDGVRIGIAEVGEVTYSGPNVMLGYADSREDLGKGDELHGRLETGDVGYLDEDGYLYLTGRTKRFAKIAGLRLGLDQLEQEFLPAGLVACIDGYNMIIVYYENVSDAALKERARALAEEYKLPPTSFSLRRISTIPRTPGGKINYRQLKEAAGV